MAITEDATREWLAKILYAEGAGRKAANNRVLNFGRQPRIVPRSRFDGSMRD
jgi:hypothetical protein